jgi:hypothetical protein
VGRDTAEDQKEITLDTRSKEDDDQSETSNQVFHESLLIDNPLGAGRQNENRAARPFMRDEYSGTTVRLARDVPWRGNA